MDYGEGSRRHGVSMSVQAGLCLASGGRKHAQGSDTPHSLRCSCLTVASHPQLAVDQKQWDGDMWKASR